MLILGEIHTGLLRHSTPVTTGLARDLLDLVAGEAVRVSERPISCAWSPDLTTGVDCTIAGTSGRAVGTVRHRAVLTAGCVVQASAYTTVERAAEVRRLPWSHYISRPGQVELLAKTPPATLAEAFLTTERGPGALDLGGICARTIERVQASPRLDRRVPLRVPRTRFRWAAMPGERRVHLLVDEGDLRTLRLTLPELPAARIADLCADVARHDWLLSSLIEVIDASALGVRTREETLPRLAPAIDTLLHLWMPAARLDDEMAAVWESLERRPGFTRHWATLVSRIRDQLSVGTVEALSATAGVRV
ncbi:hypothetical protein J2S43_005074 [Catenuloplanes nepalensis]|uniref:Uncharacterized protein n=1 Tax=Catenuloplanes nepalensis TaxID=587533 RepID=A0ABT9MYR0_9ACTN|nr:SCO2521 family protein [Catenuloplanes nepalensis]MDP9796562.1 hypothetical protein [Catenuloplanes nepalensis]